MLYCFYFRSTAFYYHYQIKNASGPYELNMSLLLTIRRGPQTIPYRYWLFLGKWLGLSSRRGLACPPTTWPEPSRTAHCPDHQDCCVRSNRRICRCALPCRHVLCPFLADCEATAYWNQVRILPPSYAIHPLGQYLILLCYYYCSL